MPHLCLYYDTTYLFIVKLALIIEKNARTTEEPASKKSGHTWSRPQNPGTCQICPSLGSWKFELSLYSKSNRPQRTAVVVVAPAVDTHHLAPKFGAWVQALSLPSAALIADHQPLGLPVDVRSGEAGQLLSRGLPASLREISKEGRAFRVRALMKASRWPSRSAVKAVCKKNAKPMCIGGCTAAAIFRRAGMSAAFWSKLDETAHQPGNGKLNSQGHGKQESHSRGKQKSHLLGNRDSQSGATPVRLEKTLQETG